MIDPHPFLFGCLIVFFGLVIGLCSIVEDLRDITKKMKDRSK